MALPNPSQSNYLQTAANKNSLVSQLFSAKPISPFTSTQATPSPFVTSQPKATTAPVIAASSNVKNPTTSFPGGSQALASTVNNAIAKSTTSTPNPSAGQNETVAAGTNTPGYSYQNGILSSIGGNSTGYTQPKASTPVKKTTVNNPDGSSQTTEYHAPEPTQGFTEASKTQTPTYPGLVTSLAQNSLTQSPLAATAGKALLNAPSQNDTIAQRAEDTRNDYAGKIAKVGQLGAGAVAGDMSTGTDVVGEGNAAIASQSASQRMQALASDEQQNLAALNPELAAQSQAQSALTSAGSIGNTAQAQLQSGLTSAAGATAPVQLPYSNQLVTPTTGQPVNGGLTGNLQDSVAQITQRIQNGQMSYDQGVQALSGYGQGGVNALQQSLGPNFNVAQSNALAGQQGTIGPAYTYAKTALTNLQNAVAGLSGPQSTNIPIINAITQGLSTTFGVGSEGVQAYKGALAEARSAIQKVLASVQGGTPTDYVGQSNALLPDNATPAQIAAASKTLDTLGQAKVDIYGNPGASNNSNSNAQSNSNPAGWF